MTKFKVGDKVSLDLENGAEWLRSYQKNKNSSFSVLEIKKWVNTPGYCVRLEDFSHADYFDPTWFKLANSEIIRKRLGIK